jgi:hypothetical protein
MTNTPESDDALVERLRTTAMVDRIDDLLDAVNDTATWQPAQPSDVDGRVR